MGWWGTSEREAGGNGPSQLALTPRYYIQGKQRREPYAPSLALSRLPVRMHMREAEVDLR
jgi:hypothetical protein